MKIPLMPYVTNGYAAAGTPLALVGNRGAHDPSGVCRPRAWWDDNCTDPARGRILRSRAGGHSQVGESRAEFCTIREVPWRARPARASLVRAFRRANSSAG